MTCMKHPDQETSRHECRKCRVEMLKNFACVIFDEFEQMIEKDVNLSFHFDTEEFNKIKEKYCGDN